MSVTWEQISNLLSLGGTIQNGLTKQQQAEKNLGDVCNQWYDNPTPENREKVYQAWKDWYHTPAENVSDTVDEVSGWFTPPTLGELADTLGLKPNVGDVLKGLQDSAGNPFSYDRLEQAQNLLDQANGRLRSEADIERCSRAGDYFKQSKSLPSHRIDPLAIDLDGDGVETAATTASVLFDHDGDGIKTASGWVKGDDGFLVLDNNGNGQIDNGSELFGADTVLSNGQKATDGFQALAAIDSNGNGQIDAGDSAFLSLRIWRDIDQDGISQADELFSLADVGISSISLAQTTHNQDLGNGNALLATASVTYTDGSTTTAASLALAEDKFNSEYVDAIAVSAEALALPSMTGMGLVRNLSESATLSSTLLGVLSQYATASTVFDQKSLLDPLVSEWANTVAVPSLGVTYEFAGIQHYINNDANAGETEAYQTMLQKLHVLEVFNGESFAGSGVANLTLVAGQVTLLNQAYDSLKEGIYSSLLSETLLKPYYDAIEYEDNEPSPHLDYSGVVALLDQKIAADPSAGIADLVELYRQSCGFFQATGWDVTDQIGLAISEYAIEDSLVSVLSSYGVLAGGVGDDVLQATSIQSTVFGGNGNDAISGGSEAATIYGGAGDDTIRDVLGNNTIYGGDGNDTITFGYNYNNVLDGGAGDDLIQMESYNCTSALYANTYTGGTGNDRIVSGGGSDTYLFRRGDGQDRILDFNGTSNNSTTDTITLGTGITQSDLVLGRISNDLVIKINDPANPSANDQITIESWFSDDRYRIENLVFSDGTNLTKSQLTAMGNVQYGTDGADTLNGFSDNTTIYGGAGDDTIRDVLGNNTIYGGDGNDTITFGYNYNNVLDGGAGDDLIQMESYNCTSALYANTYTGGTGNDRIVSGGGSDTYLFRRGDGQDRILDFNGTSNNSTTDTITLGTGITQSDLVLGRISNDLVIKINDPANPSANDQITIESWFSDDRYRIENLVFSDGTNLTKSQLTAMGNVQYGTDGADTLNGFSDNTTIYGGAGDDTIRDVLGNNTIYGGDGNDTITFGYNYNNVLDGGAGDDLIQMESYNCTSALYANTYTGGTGNDRIVSGGGSDTYLFRRGDGQDRILDFNGTSNNSTTDTITLGTGITQSDLVLGRISNDLVIKINDPANPSANDQITIESWFSDDRYRIENLVFSDGTNLTKSQLTAMGNVQYGTDGADTLNGFSDNTTIYGGAGDDTIRDVLGNNTIYGGDGNDTITFGYNYNNVLDGGAGDDLIQMESYNCTSALYANTYTGGTGNDRIVSGGGSDTYLFRRGDGQDRILDFNGTSNNSTTDTITLGTNIVFDQLWFRHVGNDLEMSVIGSSERITIENWYSGSNYHIEQFKTADNKVLLDTQVETLVQAMAAFAPPSAGQTTLPQNYQDALTPVIAANWQ